MADFFRASPCIPCMDRWPPGTFTKSKEAAYRREQKVGNISGLAIDLGNGITTIKYLSCIPQEWMLRQLADNIHTEIRQLMIGELE